MSAKATREGERKTKEQGKQQRKELRRKDKRRSVAVTYDQSGRPVVRDTTK